MNSKRTSNKLKALFKQTQTIIQTNSEQTPNKIQDYKKLKQTPNNSKQIQQTQNKLQTKKIKKLYEITEHNLANMHCCAIPPPPPRRSLRLLLLNGDQSVLPTAVHTDRLCYLYFSPCGNSDL